MSEQATHRSLQRRLLWWWILVGSLAVLTFAGRAAGDSEPAAADTFYRYETFAFGVVLYVLLLGLVLLIAAGMDLRDAFALRRPASWKRAGLIALGAFVTMWIVAAILEQIFHAGEEQGLDPERLSVDRLAPFLLNVLLAAVIVAIVEEMIYRGIGFRLLVQFGHTAAIVVTSFAFALAHGIVEGIPVFFAIGAALGFVRSRTGSIYPAMLMHGAFNGIQVVLGAAL